MEDIDTKSTDPEVESADTKNGDPPDFVVVDRLQTLYQTQEDLRKMIQTATKTMTSLKDRFKSFELEVEDARRKWDIFRGYSLLTLPAVFAYIFEAMLTTSSANMTLAHDTKAVLVIFKGLCLVFSLCVGLPFLIEEVLTYNAYLARRDVIGQPRIGDNDEDDVIDDRDVSDNEWDNAAGDGTIDTIDT